MASGTSATGEHARAADARAEADTHAAGARDAAVAQRHIGIPAGPRMHPFAQTLTWAVAPTWFMDRCAERFGEAFTITFWPSGLQLVLISDPEAVKTVFTAPGEL